MRALDIGTALVISLLSLVAMGMTDPSQTRGQASQMQSQIQLQRAIIAMVDESGIGLFAGGKLSEICAALKAYSNATVSFNAILYGDQCRFAESGATVSSLTVSFTGRRVVVEAWNTGSAA